MTIRNILLVTGAVTIFFLFIESSSEEYQIHPPDGMCYECFIRNNDIKPEHRWMIPLISYEKNTHIRSSDINSYHELD